MTWTKKERFEAILAKEQVDRPAISCWKHFLDHEQSAEQLADATIQFQNDFDWDWLKINPRATYLAEVWGNSYDLDDYSWVFPKQTNSIIKNLIDINAICEQNVQTNHALQEQIQVVRMIHASLPDVPKIQTVFSPLTVLLFLAGQGFYVDTTIYGSKQPISIKEMFTNNRAGVHQALHQIAKTMANYVQDLGEAGSSGLFYAVTGTAHHALFDTAAFNEFSRPYDGIVLEAASKQSVVLHTCGAYAKPDLFEDYPIDAISWDTCAEGNPNLSVPSTKIKVGGVNHHLFVDDQLEVLQQQTVQALQTMESTPFFLTPNCAVSPDASNKAMHAFKNMILEEEFK